ncbi:MAG: hypothetical protein GKR93_11550 [Gammaproteobacteria bacterium]|nr:hypothetical protein [Gammaproteobacteria bacterium]
MKNLVLTLLLFLNLLPLSRVVEGRAFCALRDPVSSINNLFPEATQHQSLVKAINADIRSEINEVLPFTLHFNELGKHTLYVVQKYGDAQGFVHVRSELTEWGLVEIAWALELDLSMRNLQFQRCRIPGCDVKHLPNILDLTVGKSYSEIRDLLSKDGTSLRPDLQTKLGDSHSFSYSAIKSALKTILVTGMAWNEEVGELNRQAMINRHYGHEASVSVVDIPVNELKLKQLDEIMGGGGSMVERESVKSFQIQREGNMEGTIVTANWRDGDYRGMYHWLFDTEKRVIDILTIPNWPNEQARTSFNQLLGTKIMDEEQCHTAAQIAGFELYFLSHN